MRNLRWVGVILCMGFLTWACGRKAGEQEVVDPEELTIQANMVFFYYQNLDAAEKFYTEILGLEKVLDYGFAKIHHISQTSFICLVDVIKGMHDASEPKAVTLAFVTDEVDAWYTYLNEQGVQMRGPVGDASRHPTRGFVAYDPEGYFLEFEKFLDHPQNEKLLEQLAPVESVYSPQDLVTSRPSSLGIKANVFWLYYQDIPEAQKFYTDNIKSRLLVDQGFAKVYSSSASAFIGLVDGEQGLHKFSPKKAVNVAFLTDRIDEWYAEFTGKGLRIKDPVETMESIPVRAFVTYDSGGYYLEFDRFLEDDRNIRIRELLTASN